MHELALSDNSLAAIIIFFLVALPTYGVSYLIGCKKMTQLISGYQAEKVSNPEAYANSIAFGLFIFANIMCFCAWALYTQALSADTLFWLFMGASCAPLVTAIYAKLKHSKN